MKGNTVTQSADVRPTLPLSVLRLSPRNVRKLAPGSIESMAASIRALGVIHNLSVIRDAENPGDFEVIVGGRRLRALHLLREQGTIADDYPVPYALREASEATAVSLAENVQREAMHPADEFDAFVKLTKEGLTIDQIADTHGVTPLVVERRLVLANAAPALLAAFRENELSTDQLIALCSTDDHALQESTWANAPSWNRNANALRRLVTSAEIDVNDDKRVAFIGGVAALEAAGGVVRRDLFSEGGSGGFTRDVALLDKLVADVLETQAAAVRAEGWGWVDVVGEFDYQTFQRFGRINREPGTLSADDAAAVSALTAEEEALEIEMRALQDDEGEFSDEDERIDAIDDRLGAIAAEIETIQDATADYPDTAKPHAGAWVAFDRGKVRIERGLVKAEDRKALAGASAAEVDGGRVTKAAGRKDNALSDALRRSLLGRRNRAAQLATAANPRVAKVLLALAMIGVVTERAAFSGDVVPSDLSLRDTFDGATRTHHPIAGADAETLGDQLADGLKSLLGGLPKNRVEQWAFLADKTDADLDAIIAYGVAASVSLATGHTGLTAKLLGALAFDVADHVTMTADNFFGRVPKTLILDSLKEAGLDHDRAALEAMKKGALASEAETRIRESGSRWVPKLIRTPAPKAATPAKPKAAKAAKAASKAKPAAKKATSKPAAKAKAKPSKR